MLFLSPEEKKRALDYVTHKLQFLDAERFKDLGRLVADARNSLRLVQAGRSRFEHASNPYAEIMKRLYDEALVGYAQLIQQTNRAYSAKERQWKDLQRGQGEVRPEDAKPAEQQEKELPDDLKALLLDPSMEELEAASDYLDKRVEAMDFEDLTAFREATQKLLIWWESPQGQTDGLMLNLLGDIGTPKGRLAMRAKIERVQQEVTNPTKTWLQGMNVTYSKKKREHAEKAANEGPWSR